MIVSKVNNGQEVLIEIPFNIASLYFDHGQIRIRNNQYDLQVYAEYKTDH